MRVVLDANVLISAAIRPSGAPGMIMSAFIERNAFELVLSPSILAETEAAFKLRRVRKYLRNRDQALLWLSDLAALADLVNDTDRAKGACRDPGDDAVLSAAIEGRAEVIVTGDEDLLVLRDYEGISIMPPRSFLGLIRASPSRAAGCGPGRRQCRALARRAAVAREPVGRTCERGGRERSLRLAERPHVRPIAQSENRLDESPAAFLVSRPDA